MVDGQVEDQGDQSQGENGGESGNGFKPIATQEELNAVIKDRLARATSKYADYKDLQAKASKLDDLEQANKSESEKSAERLAVLERELEATRTSALRSRIQARFSIEDEDAELFLTASDEDTLVKQAERLSQRAEGRKKNGNHVSQEGRTSTSGDGKDADERQFVRNLFAPGD